MPIRTHFDADHNLRLHVVTGVVSQEDLTAELTAIYNSSEIPAGADVLWDFVDADISGISVDDVRRLAEFVTKALGEKPGYRVAFVTGADLTFGMTRMYEQMQSAFDDKSVRVFRMPEEAWRWLRAGRDGDGS